MKDITPAHLRCQNDACCPAVLQNDDGNLTIIGTEPSEAVLAEIGDRIGEGERAIVVSPEYFKGLLSGGVGEEPVPEPQVAE